MMSAAAPRRTLHEEARRNGGFTAIELMAPVQSPTRCIPGWHDGVDSLS